MANESARAMFGTWKYDPETDEVQNLRRSFDPVTARSSLHQACDRCHEKKLKCSGEKEGCERCIASQLSCEYTRSRSRSSRRGKKQQPARRASDTKGREDSPSSTGSSKGPSPLSRDPRGPGVYPGVSRPKADPAGSSLVGGHGSALHHVEQFLQPEDAFDMDGYGGHGRHPHDVNYSHVTTSSTTAPVMATGPIGDSYQVWSGHGYVSSGSETSYDAPAGQHHYQGGGDERYQSYPGYQLDPRFWPSGR